MLGTVEEPLEEEQGHFATQFCSPTHSYIPMDIFKCKVNTLPVFGLSEETRVPGKTLTIQYRKYMKTP